MKVSLGLLIFSILNFIGMLIGFLLIGNYVPIHFNFEFVVDGMGSPWVVLLFAGLIMLLAAGLFIENKIKGKSNKNQKVLNVVMGFIVFMLSYVGWLIFGLAASGLTLGEKANFPLTLLISLPFVLLFLVFGVYLPKIKKNAWFGIRTFSTLKSEYVWDKTHRLGGIMSFVCAGIVLLGGILSAVLGIEWILFMFLFVGILVFVVPCMIYANVLFKKEERAKDKIN